MKDRAERIRRRLVLYLDRAPNSMCLKDDVGLITRLKCHRYLQMSRELRSKLQLGKEVPQFFGRWVVFCRFVVDAIAPE